MICVINANYMQSTGILLQMNYGHLVGKETKMFITGIIIFGITVYAVWAVRKVRRDRKNGSCCGGSCSGCIGEKYCNK